MPFDEKFVPDANSDWPLPSWLTPGADNATAKMSRLFIIGSSEMRVVSNRTPTSALVVLSSGASARTSTFSDTPAG